MVRIACISYQCYIWIRGWAEMERGRMRIERGMITKITLLFIHSPTSLSELWDLPSNRHIVHTAFSFSFISQNNICNHWSHTTRHSTRWKNNFPFLSAAGSRARGVARRVDGCVLRQAGDVSLWWGTFWFAGGAVGLVLEQQDPAKTRKRRWMQLHPDCQPTCNFQPISIETGLLFVAWAVTNHKQNSFWQFHLDRCVWL